MGKRKPEPDYAEVVGQRALAWQHGEPIDMEQVALQPVYPEDSLEDVLLELIAPAKLAPAVLGKIVKFIELKISSATATDEIATRRLLEVIRKLAPPKYAIMDWWALHFAIESDHTKNMTARELARILRVAPRTPHHHIRRWRLILGLPATNPSRRNEGNRINHRHRRESQSASKG